MPSIFYSKKLRYLNREYLFQTTYNEADHTAVCSYFTDGKLLNINFMSLPGEIDKNELVGHIMQIHERKVNDLEILLKVTESAKVSEKAQPVIKLGKTLLENKLYDEALELLQAASRKHRDNSEIRFLLGEIYAAKESFDAAESELRTAVELSPNYPDLRNLLGETYLQLKKPLAAIEQFIKALELNVYYHRAFYNLGLGYILNGIVREDYELAKDIQGQCDQAFEKALAINPAYGSENYRIGRELLRQGNYAEAYDKLSAGFAGGDANSSFEGLLDLYIRCIYDDGKFTEANVRKYIEKIENLLQANPGYADLENDLGMAYTIMGKIMRDRAISHFKKATEINPVFERAMKNIKLSEYDLKGFNALLEAILK